MLRYIDIFVYPFGYVHLQTDHRFLAAFMRMLKVTGILAKDMNISFETGVAILYLFVGRIFRSL